MRAEGICACSDPQPPNLGGKGWEESEEGAVDAVDDECKVLGIVLEVELVFLYHHHAAGVFMLDEVLVAVVQVLQVFQLYLLLIVAPAFLDVSHEMCH